MNVRSPGVSEMAKKTSKRILSAAMALSVALVLGIGSLPAVGLQSRPAAAITTVEVAGATRYETAIEASKLSYPSGTAHLVIASGEDWPDAVSASALAGRLQAPLLLTRLEQLPSTVADEVRRLGSVDAIVIGGETSVSEAVVAELRTLVSSGRVTRVSGANRYETAYAVALEVTRLAADSYDGRVFVATGLTFADALAVSPLASASGSPVFLASPNDSAGLVQEMFNRGAGEVVILGGTTSVSADVETRLVAALGNSGVTRIAGADRYATAAAIAQYGVSHDGLAWNGVGLATGTDFPDALAGGTTLGSRRAVLLLTRTTSLSAPAAAALSANSSAVNTIVFLGSESALSSATRIAAINALR